MPRFGAIHCPTAKISTLVLRYGTAIDKQLHKAMDRLRQVQAARRAAEAAAVEGGHLPRREVYETKPPRRTSRRAPGAWSRRRGAAVVAVAEVAMEAKIKRAALPSEKVLNRILRYEAANDRQLHRALTALGQVQDSRRGGHDDARETGGDGGGTSSWSRSS